MNKTLGVLRKLPDRYSVVAAEAWPRIYAYGVVFIISLFGNSCVLVSVSKRFRLKSSPMNKLLLHLCLADLIVTFVYVGVEVLWRISIGWYVGGLLCKVVQYLRAFGLYLSAMLLMCITLDRYYAVVHPLKVINGSKRVRLMLVLSWTSAIICAVPQSVLFRVESHPSHPSFTQCITIWIGETAEILNTAFSLALMYIIPLGTILFSYGNIILVLCRRTTVPHPNENIIYSKHQFRRPTNIHNLNEFENYEDKQLVSTATRNYDANSRETFLRRSGTSLIERAKQRTLKLSCVIVIAFMICWTPYSVITLWHMIDRQSAELIDYRIQDAMFIFACANSCVQPFIYGCFQQKRPSYCRSAPSTLGYQPSISTVTANQWKRNNTGNFNRSLEHQDETIF